MIAAIASAFAAGLLARAIVNGDKPGLLVTPFAGLGGCVLAFLIGDQLLGMHEMHLFAPEALLPATAAATGLLVAGSRLRHAGRRKTTF